MMMITTDKTTVKKILNKIFLKTKTIHFKYVTPTRLNQNKSIRFGDTCRFA